MPPWVIRIWISPAPGVPGSRSSILRSPAPWTTSAFMTGDAFRSRSDDGCHAAVDVDDLAVDEVGGGRDEEAQGADEVVHLTPATGRRASAHPRAELLVLDEGRGQLRREVTGRQGVHLDAGPGKVRAHSAGEHDDAALRGRVRRDPRTAELTLH